MQELVKRRPIEASLCSKDPRNPNRVDLDDIFSDKETIETQKSNCYCDNCFYGRSVLAQEILRLRYEIASLNGGACKN